MQRPILDKCCAACHNQGLDDYATCGFDNIAQVLNASPQHGLQHLPSAHGPARLLVRKLRSQGGKALTTW
ncbi:MAG TPA: hypothetical protein VGR71_17070, partial [Nitrospira sp.]|nr:hypothetical protein [Nitrospira sp.]